VVLINLQVIARISIDKQQFVRVLNALVQLFLEDRTLLETRGALIIRKLCALLDCRNIFMSLASTMMSSNNDIEFASTMVQTLNLILLTAPELLPLRKSLTGCFRATANASDKEAFLTLFKCWSQNPVATFSLCLLAQSYDLSAALIHRFGEVDVTVGFLMQIDKLIQLLESPIFMQLRLQLLEVDTENHSDLLKSLYGLLMLLPQSQAYKTLSDRLATVSSLKMHLAFSPSGHASTLGKVKNTESSVKKIDNGADFIMLLDHFSDVQKQQSEFRFNIVREKRLLKHPNLENPSAISKSASSDSIS
jgi:vacuole morphology and inheritance protein 14